MKNRKAIILLFLANIVSGLAQGISMIAIPWYFVSVVSRPEVFASAYLVITFLTLFWGLYAGTLVDRYSRKKLFIMVNLISGFIIAFIACYGFYMQYLPDLLVILVFGITIFNYNVHYPNLYAFGQEITQPKDYGRLNSYIEVQGQTTSVLAGAFAAMLLTGTDNKLLEVAGLSISLPFDIKAWHIYEIFLMDAITYIFVILFFIFIKYDRITKEKMQKGFLYDRFIDGLKYLKKNPLIFMFGFLTYMLFAFTLVNIHVVLPAYVKNFLEMGGNIYASAEVYYSIGAIFSGFLILKIFKNMNTLMSIMVLMSFVAIAFYLMSEYKLMWVFFFGNLILGITNAGIRILRTTFLFNNIPNNFIGRAGSVFGSLNIIVRMLMIGLFALPYFSFHDNIRYAYLIGMVLMILVVLLLSIWYKKILSLK